MATKEKPSQDALMTKEENEESEQFKAWKNAQSQAPSLDSQSIAEIGPEFAGALQSLGVDYMHMDPALRQHLRHSVQARKVCLAPSRAQLNKSDPSTGHWFFERGFASPETGLCQCDL